MKQRRLRNGRYRVNYAERLFPVALMLWSAGLAWGLQTGTRLRIEQVQAREGANNANAGWIQPTTTPSPTPQLKVVEKVVFPTATPTPDESELIDQAVNEFLPNHKSESLMIMHCLAHRESGHGASNAHGDNGLAGGPFQFHEATWERMRKQMGEPFSTRYDFKEAARTTAWAIANGRALEWGPILRASKGSNYASCQVPSWYR